MSADNGVLYVEFEAGREIKAGLINCGPLTSQQDNELAAEIAERFNATVHIDRKELPVLKKMLECQAADLLLLIKTGAALLTLSDAVRAATPEGEALPAGLDEAMKQADAIIEELNTASEQRQQEGGSDE